jgi:hypothetical protein
VPRLTRGLSLLSVLSLLSCAPSASESEDDGKIEDLSPRILGRDFADLDRLRSFIDSYGIAYDIIEETQDSLKDPPDENGVDWQAADPMYFLILRYEGGEKIYRYRVYPDRNGPLHIESDFGFKNPYQ